MLDKTAWRQRLLAARKNFDLVPRLLADQQIALSLLGAPEWQNARSVGCYVALPDEVQTQAILESGLKTGKTMAAPVITRKSEPMYFYQLALNQELQPGPMGILQPPRDQKLLPENLEVLIVPGVGFDLQGKRLGYGAGFYDQYLAGFRGLALGLAYDLQVVDRLPATDRDFPMQMLITETRVLRFT